MRVRVACPVCIGDAASRKATPDEMRAAFERRITVFITTTPWSSATCDVGHRFAVEMNDPGYALLYERALQRLASGDWRDAVLDAYTALDMYASTVPVRARYDRDATLAPGDIPRLRAELKAATGRSERALGAAFAVASLVAGRAPPQLSSGLQNVRNDAIHGGLYPSPAKAESAVYEVESLIVELESMLDSASKGRDPCFRLARQMADFQKLDPSPQGQTALTLCSTLGGNTEPRPTARDQVAAYGAGTLPSFLLD